MFAVRCPRHGRQVLLGISDIRSLAPAPEGGFTVGYRCTCGYEGYWPPAASEESPGGPGVSPGHRAA